MAQWIAQADSSGKVAGSSPAEGAVGSQPRRRIMFLTTAGLVVRGLGGWAKHNTICLRPSADRIVLRLGSPFDYGARGFNVNTLFPLVEFSEGDANQKFPFLFFPLRGGGVGGGGARKMQGNFWVCPRESASAVEALPAQAERTWRVQATTRSTRAKWVRAKANTSPQMICTP